MVLIIIYNFLIGIPEVMDFDWQLFNSFQNSEEITLQN